MARTSVLSRLPALATLGVGSLPFIDPQVAVRHATRAYDLPFCPQLPALDGNMIDEWLGSDPARCGWHPGRDREEPRAWADFVAAVDARPPAHGLVKLQVTGPLTLAAGLERANGGPGTGRGAHALAGELATWLAGNVAPQIRELDRLGLQTVLVVDEPGLASLGAGPAQARVWDSLRAVAPAWGLHVCGPVPWALVEVAEPDLLSYDLVRYGLSVEAAAVMERMVVHGTHVAFGAVDPAAPEGAVSAVERVKAPLVALARATGRPVPELAQQVLLSPACGTGWLSGQRERLIAAELGAAALHLRDFLDTPAAADLHRGHLPRAAEERRPI